MEIQYVLDWIEKRDGCHFLWIQGAAGMGKSTLAHRLFDHVKEEGILATFAYFSLGTDIHPKEPILMMTRELSSLHPGCRPDVARAINECSGTHQAVKEYLTHFLVKPIVSLAYAGPLVIILDALDEWASRKQFLKALCEVNLPSNTAVKFVMTSRYLDDIQSIFGGSVTVYQLPTVSPVICRKYFEDRFKDTKWTGPRLDQVTLDRLVKLADGLLIWAATVCNLLSPSPPHPTKKLAIQTLNGILSSSPNQGHKERMEDLYRAALERIFPTEDKEWHSKLFLLMVALREPLPLKEFARLVQMTEEFVQDACSRLRALQTRGTFDHHMVQPAIELFHASFIEHLDQSNQAHRVMANTCICFFEEVTEPDVGQELGPFPFERAEQYIGKYLVYHMQEAPQANVFLTVTSHHLRLWVGCLLSHLFLLGDTYGYGSGSGALKSLSDALVSTQGITYSPERFSCDMSPTEMVVLGFQQALKLGRMDYHDANFYTENPEGKFKRTNCSNN